jgi:DNA primase
MNFRDKILAAYPLRQYIEAQGHPINNKNQFSCFIHRPDKHPSATIDDVKGLWCCHVCKIGGTVIDLHMRQQNMTIKQAMKDLSEKANIKFERTVVDFEYRNSYGKPVMGVERVDNGVGDKNIRQFTRNAKGEKVYSVEGVQRVLFQLDKWCDEPEVCLCEGEKCVLALESLGFLATTNPGGSGAWLDAYAGYLKDKHITVFPDSDEPAKKWIEAVIASCEGKVASIRIVRVPAPYNDVADIVEAQGAEEATKMICGLLEHSQRVDRGVYVPILSMGEAYEKYQRQCTTMSDRGIDMGKWLPSLRQCTRILMPGDMVVLLSDTGVGKTSMLTTLAASQEPLPVLFFELELSVEALAERFLARCNNQTTFEVENNTRKGLRLAFDKCNHVYICDESKLTLEKIEEYTLKSELKIQQKPAMILIDYIGLMSGGTGKRYERLSTIAEGLKVLARTTQTVVVVASQIHRKDPDDNTVGLHDAKDSGSVENSAQLVIGAWRPEIDRLTLKILKCTKNTGTHEINCIFDGNRQTIKEITDESSRYQ